MRVPRAITDIEGLQCEGTMGHPMFEPGSKNRMGYYRMLIRATEWAARERISLLDIAGFGPGTMRILYESGLNTASKLMVTPTLEIIQQLVSFDGFPKKEAKARRMVEDWKALIRDAWRNQIDEPLPPDWGRPPP